MAVKPKLLRVITDARVLPWHLGKTLKMLKDDFEIFVVGEGVSQYQYDFPYISLIDLPITPKIKLSCDIRALIGLSILILRIKPDIVHSIMPKASLLASLASFFLVPVRLHTFTGQVWQTKLGSSRWMLKGLDKLVVKMNTLCMTDSFSQSDFLYNEGIRTADNNPLPVISKGSLGGVDLDVINIQKKECWRNEIRSRYNISKETFVIGFLARKTKDKGALIILEAFELIASKYNNVVLMYIGPDDSAGGLDRYKMEHPYWNKGVIEIDAVTSHEKYLAGFDVLCLPSCREGFGSIVIDAAALAIPAIGSRIFGLTDAIIENETGLLIECGSKEHLVEAVFSLIENNKLLDRLGNAAYQRAVKNFDYRVLAAELSRLYTKLLLERKSL
jgi:glycosyltransferase involved in cell wall biosynthesis